VAHFKDTDFARFANYRTFALPVTYGEKYGIVSTLSHKNNLTNSLLCNHASGISQMIDEEKYFMSLDMKCDVGPTVAIANIVDKGKYSQFIKKYNIKLTGLEHILKVNEDGHTHHIMSLDTEQSFATEEQIGMMKYSAWCHIAKNHYLDKELTDEFLEWVTQKNAALVREVLSDPEVRVKKIFNFPFEYNNCVIYKDFTDKIIEKLQYRADEIETAQKSLAKTEALSKI